MGFQGEAEAVLSRLCLKGITRGLLTSSLVFPFLCLCQKGFLESPPWGCHPGSSPGHSCAGNEGEQVPLFSAELK